MPGPHPRTILLVAGDETLVYLISRYADRSGLTVHVQRTPPDAALIASLRPDVVWFPSLESFEASRPRESGLLSSDAPLVVCSAAADEQRARELGADHCALHPLTYPDFLAALEAVGVGS